MGRLQGKTSDTQGVMSAIATTKRKQNEKYWQFQAMGVGMPGEKDEQTMWLFWRNG